MHKINNAFIFCLFSFRHCFRQCTFNCFGYTEIHPLRSCMLINLIELSVDVLHDRAEHSPLSSFKRLTELSHQLSFHISTVSIPNIHCSDSCLDKKTNNKMALNRFNFYRSFPTFSSSRHKGIAYHLEKGFNFPS